MFKSLRVYILDKLEELNGELFCIFEGNDIELFISNVTMTNIEAAHIVEIKEFSQYKSEETCVMSFFCLLDLTIGTRFQICVSVQIAIIIILIMIVK